MFSSCHCFMEYFLLNAATQLSGDVSVNDGQQIQQKKNTSFTDLGPLKDTERQDLNCAVKEYLLIAGYRLTAMTFYEEVSILCSLFFCDFLILFLFCILFFWLGGGCVGAALG